MDTVSRRRDSRIALLLRTGHSELLRNEFRFWL